MISINSPILLEDKELVEKLKNEESKNFAFNQLVKKYQKQIYWHIRKMVIDHDDADDLIQEVFIKVYKNIGQFREDAQLYTWLYRIATNECLTFLNKKRKRFFLPLVDLESELSKVLDASPYISGDDIQIRLQKALLKLPDKQRMVFNMKYFDDMKYEEISEITETTVGALKASYHHAVKKIEEYLKVSLNH